MTLLRAVRLAGRAVAEAVARAAILLVKDLAGLLANARAVLLAMVLPCIFLYLVGQLRTQPIEAHVLIAGAGSIGTPERAAADAVARALGELTGIRVTVDEGMPVNVAARLKEGRFDVLVLRQTNTSVLYTATIEPFRFAALQQTVPRIEAVLEAARTNASRPPERSRAGGALDIARLQLREISGVARRWENGPPPLSSSGEPVHSIPCDGNMEPQASTIPLTPMAVARAARTEQLCTARKNALLGLETALSGRPDAFSWRAVRARVEKLEEQLAALRVFSTPSVEASERDLLGSLAADAATIATSIKDDGPADAPPQATTRELLELALPAHSRALVPLYPVAGDRPRALLPEIAALILCVLPFVLSCNALIREREEKTLDVVLATPRMSLSSIIAGKSGSAVVVTLAVCLSLLVVMHVAYDLFIKSGVLALIAFGIVPAATAAALLGVAASAWTSSSLQSTIASAIYLLLQALVGGLLYPVAAGATDVVSVLAIFFPLTFVGPAVRGWAFGSSPAWTPVLLPLLAMCVGYAVLARLAIGRLVKRL